MTSGTQSVEINTLNHLTTVNGESVSASLQIGILLRADFLTGERVHFKADRSIPELGYLNCCFVAEWVGLVLADRGDLVAFELIQSGNGISFLEVGNIIELNRVGTIVCSIE